MRYVHESESKAHRRSRRHWPATIGTLILGVVVGAMVGIGMTSRPSHVRDPRPMF